MTHVQLLAALALSVSSLAALHSFWSSCGISVAETLLPPLKGRVRVATSAMLIASATVSGATLGFVLGLPAEIASFRIHPLVAAALTVVALLGDVVFRRTGALRPYGLHKQVPITWARIFHPVTAATLYGARLGIGPLTIPTTWLWWTTLVAGALSGVWISVGVGAAYGLVKTSAIVLVGLRHREDMPVAMERLLRREWPARRALLLLATVPVGVVVLASCDTGNDDQSASTSQVTQAIDDTTSTTLAPSSTTTTIGMPDARPATDVVLNDVPTGFVLDTAPEVTGTFDINSAAAIESDPQQELTTLQTRGFTQGYSRGWSDSNDDTITVVVYDFATTEGATAYLGDGQSIVTGRGGSPFAVAGLPGAIGFSYFLPATSTDVPFTTHSVAFARSNRWYLVVTGGRTQLGNDTASSSELVQQLAAQQRVLVEGA